MSRKINFMAKTTFHDGKRVNLPELYNISKCIHPITYVKQNSSEISGESQIHDHIGIF